MPKIKQLRMVIIDWDGNVEEYLTYPPVAIRSAIKDADLLSEDPNVKRVEILSLEYMAANSDLRPR